MNSKERFYASMEYKTPDRPPMSPLHAQPYVFEALYKHLGVTTHEEFQLRTGEDFRFVGPEYTGPVLRRFDDDSYEGLWGERYKRLPFAQGTYEEPVFQPYKDIEEIEELKDMRIPSADLFDYSGIAKKCDRYKSYIVSAGSPGIFDFMNGTGFIRGIEQVYLDVGLESEVFLWIVEKRFEFHYEMIKRTLAAAPGKIDVVYCGEDLGTQQGPVLSVDKFIKLFGDKYKRLFSLAHANGAKTMMHSCGGMRSFIPELISLGLDILDVVQVDAAGMDIKGLHKDFYKKIAFCGSLSVQSLLPKGTPDDIRNEIKLRKELFCEGGIIIGPTNVMQADMPIENFIAMCQAIGSMQ